MSKIFSIMCKGSANIYSGGRNIRVDLGIPFEVNEKTGLMVLIPGYGGNIDSNVYKKMRETFPDNYNMIIVQCDYFGNRHMGSEEPKELKNILLDSNILSGSIEYLCESKEDVCDFNDTGIMQGLDIVNATISVLKWLSQESIYVDSKKLMLFGTSHGGYLAHLANIVAPMLYTCIIDVSAYISPYYINNLRRIRLQTNNMEVDMLYKQYVNIHPELLYNSKLYDLKFLYHNMSNRCKIIALQGTKDWMVDYNQKKEFVNEIDNAELMLLDEEDIDGTVFKNADHGLGLDYIEFFKMFMPIIMPSLEKGEGGRLPKLGEEIYIGDEDVSMKICYEGGLPRLQYISK